MQSGQLITLLLIGVVFYLFLIAPARRRQRQTAQMTASLEPGAEVMTTAGLFATVVAVNDDSVDLEVAPGIVSRYAKGAISRVVPPAEPDDPSDASDDTETDSHDDDLTAGDPPSPSGS